MTILENKHTTSTPSFIDATASSPIAIRQVTLLPSRCWCVGIVSLHVLMAVAVGLCAIPLYMHILLWGILLITVSHFVWGCYHHPIYHLLYRDKRWYLAAAPSNVHEPIPPLHIRSCTFWSTRLLFVEVSSVGRTTSMALVYDQCSQDDYRWLRVVLKNYA